MGQAEHILENLPSGCIVFESSGIITYVNPALCEMLDCSRESLSGKNLEVLLTISSRIFYQTHFFPLLRLQGYVNEIFLHLKSHTNAPVPVLVNVKSSEQNGQLCYIATLTTVWEREKYEQELILARKEQEKASHENDILTQLKGKLEINQQQLDSKLAQLQERSEEYMQIGKVLTHDMQEPIRKISLFFNTLLEKNRIQQESEDIRKIEIINRSIFQLKKLTNALFDFVSLNSFDEAITSLHAKELIQQAEKEVRQSLGYEEFTVQISHIPDFFGKETQIKRVFVELLKNAVQNRDPQRPLFIQINSVQIQSNSYQKDLQKYRYVDHVQLEFLDNGIGFESQYEHHIFRLSNKLNRNSAGVGLGLTLCKRIITQHHGSIKVLSKPGEGTRFTIVVPLVQVTS